MKTYTFSIDTTGHKTYEVKANSPEEACSLLLEAEESGEADENYLVESTGEEWDLRGYLNTSVKDKLLDKIGRIKCVNNK